MVLGLPDDEYHAGVDIQSCSMLKGMLHSPAHYLSSLIDRKPATEAMEMGTVIHMLALQPAMAFSRLAIYPGCSKNGAIRNTKEFKAFSIENEGRIVIDEPLFHSCQMAAERILETRIAALGKPFGDLVAEGFPEASIYYTDPDTGIQCRTRLDLWHPDGVFDIKTTAYEMSSQWLRQAHALHYDMQAYMYSLAECLHRGSESARPFWFVTVESDAPCSTKARLAGESFLLSGAQKYKHAMSAYAACTSTNYWPSPQGDEVLETPPWHMPALDKSWASA